MGNFLLGCLVGGVVTFILTAAIVAGGSADKEQAAYKAGYQNGLKGSKHEDNI